MKHRIAPLVCLAACASLLTVAPASAAPETVAAGWDLFETNQDQTRFHPIQGLPLMVNCRGIPMGSYDFPGVGIRPTGQIDTIVHRKADATPDNPIVDVELVALQMTCDVNAVITMVPTLMYVTLQSARGSNITDPAPGPASTGTLDIQFDGNGGGTASSRLDVYYDVRAGALDGPIINLPGGPMPDQAHFEANNVPWRHEKPANIDACLEELDILVDDQHGVISQDFYIAAVNWLLNGVDPGEDFNYGRLDEFCQER